MFLVVGDWHSRNSRSSNFTFGIRDGSWDIGLAMQTPHLINGDEHQLCILKTRFLDYFFFGSVSGRTGGVASCFKLSKFVGWTVRPIENTFVGRMLIVMASKDDKLILFVNVHLPHEYTAHRFTAYVMKLDSLSSDLPNAIFLMVAIFI